MKSKLKEVFEFCWTCAAIVLLCYCAYQSGRISALSEMWEHKVRQQIEFDVWNDV